MAEKTNAESDSFRGASLIDCLPPEVLILIFKFLDFKMKLIVASVCKRWKEAVYAPCLWKNVSVKLPLMCQHTYESIARRRIRRVKVVDFKTHPSWSCLAEVMNVVEDLDLSAFNNEGFIMDPLNNLNVNFDIVQHAGQVIELLMADRLPLLRRIILHPFQARNLELISGKCDHLEYLTVKEIVGDSVIREISRCFKNLRNLDVGFLFPVSAADQRNDATSLQYLTGQCPDPHVKGCPKLEHLRLENFHVCKTGIGYIQKGFSSLKSLSMHCQPGKAVTLTDNDFEDLASIKTLEKLVVPFCPDLSEVGLSHLASGAAQFVELRFHRCPGVTDEGVKHLASIKSLKRLHLDVCYNLSDAGLLYLSQGDARLTHLGIGFCKKISDQGLNYLTTGQGLLGLRWVLLIGCDLSYESVIHLQRQNPGLEHGTYSALKLI